LGPANEILWRHDLGFAASLINEFSPNPLLVDLDLDGRDEIVVGLARGSAAHETQAGHVAFAFSAAGEPLWSYSYSDLPFVFDGQRFTGATRFLTWNTDGEGHVWLSVNHHTWWPTVLVRIGRDGAADIRYVQSGGIYALAPWRAGDGRTYMVAGGVNNEYREAAVAVIDTQGSRAASPQTLGSGFHCDNCSAGDALVAFYRFPPSDVATVDPVFPYSIINQMDVLDGRIRVYVPQSRFGATVTHVILPDFGVRTLQPSDLFRNEHGLFERQGRLNHPFESCPARARLGDVKVWMRTSGWTVDGTPDG
jgi:hypothetical protein